MTNFTVLDSKSQPISIRMANTFRSPGIAVPVSAGAATSGAAFACSFTNSVLLGAVGGSGFAVLQISNPAGSGKNVYASAMLGGIDVGLTLISSFTGVAQITRGAALSSPTTASATNLRLGSNGTSVATIQTATAAVSGGSVAMQLPLLQSNSCSLPLNGQFIVPPGQTIELQAQGTVSLIAVTMIAKVNLMWWEA
ncbi:hypothetical protein [Cohnella sp. AR92]|uniref:hypothetical protein n=1 Tax=Cohnella sp. AR92 TaxID=648716 RepID=UPI000F8E02F8|nr:hypothetical protein [Cohnella sp. AR92]RUS49100.1 hypothetical protein ELR57_01810 [Cohnella sp. AR92]